MLLQKLIKRAIIAGVLLIALVLTKPFVIVRAGDVGVIYRFGSIIGQADEGFHLIYPE